MGFLSEDMMDFLLGGFVAVAFWFVIAILVDRLVMWEIRRDERKHARRAAVMFFGVPEKYLYPIHAPFGVSDERNDLGRYYVTENIRRKTVVE